MVPATSSVCVSEIANSPPSSAARVAVLPLRRSSGAASVVIHLNVAELEPVCSSARLRHRLLGQSFVVATSSAAPARPRIPRASVGEQALGQPRLLLERLLEAPDILRRSIPTPSLAAGTYATTAQPAERSVATDSTVTVLARSRAWSMFRPRARWALK